MDSHLFINKEYEKQLQEDGVIKVPFLNADELKRAREFYSELHGTNDPPAMYDGIHMTIWCNDLDYKLKVKDTLHDIFMPAADRTFTNYRAVSQQFIVKRQGKDTTFPVHQDWSIVDETKFCSFNMWVPLQDVDADNGAMWIIKRSHNINRKIRGAGCLFPNYVPIIDDLKPYMTSYPMKAGEALLFYHNTIHGSPANTLDSPRVVVQVSILPKQAPFHIYFQKQPGTPLEVHHPIDDFTYYYTRLREDSEMAPPTAKATVVEASYNNAPVTLAEIEAAIKN